MKRLLLLLAFAVPAAHAQVFTTTTTANTATTSSQVLALAPQLLAFAGSDANFAALVNGLALGTPVTLSTPLANGGSQVFTFTPGSTMSALDIAQTLEKARQALISRGVAAPTAQQIGVTLTGGTLATASGTTSATPILTGASTAATGTATTQSPANAVQATNSAPSSNAASGSTTTGVRNMSDSPFPRGIADTPPLPVPGVTSPVPSTTTTEAARPATPALAAPAIRAGDR